MFVALQVAGKIASSNMAFIFTLPTVQCSFRFVYMFVKGNLVDTSGTVPLATMRIPALSYRNNYKRRENDGTKLPF